MEKDKLQREMLYEMIDAFLEIISSNKITRETIDPFIKGIKKGNKFVWDVAGGRLTELSHHFDEVKNILIELSNNKSAKVRFRIIATLVSNPPSENPRINSSNRKTIRY